MKCLSVLSLMLVCALVWAQDAAKVTLSIPATNAKVVVEKIAQLTGAKLAVAPAAENEILIVHVSDAPLDAVLERIATVTACRWATDSDGIKRLRPDDDLRRKQAREELDLKTTEITKALAKLQETLKPKEPTKEVTKKPDEEDFFAGFMSTTPATRAIAKLSRNIPPALLAAMKDGDRIVFATSPTRMQRQLGNIGNAITELVEEHNANVAVQKKVEEKSDEAKTNEQKKAEQEMERMFGDMMGAGSKNPITAQPAKVLLIATVGGAGFGMMGDGVTLSLKVYDSQGAVILTGRHSLSGGMFGDFVTARASEPVATVPKVEQANKGKIVKLSPISAEFVKFSNVNPMAGGSYERAPSKELLEHLLRPDIYDPLSYSDSEALIALATNRKVNLIANLPDSVVSLMGAFTGRGENTDEGYLSGLKSGDEVVVTEESAWIIIKPKLPSETRENRLNRVALKDLIAATEDSGTASLDAMAKYAQKNPAPFRTPLAMTYLLHFAPNSINSGIKGPMNWDLLRLYGTFSEVQKGLLSTRQPIAFASLMPGQKSLVERLVFGASAQLVILSQDRPSGEGGFMEMMRAFLPKQSTNYRDEPTEIMPNGLPGNGQIRANRTENVIVTPVGMENEDSMRMFGALGTEEFAMMEYFRSDPQFAQFAAEIPKIEQVRAGQRLEWNFTFIVAPDVGAKGHLQDDKISKDAPVQAVSSLPQSWREQVARRVAALKRNPMPFPMGGGGSGPPPEH